MSSNALPEAFTQAYVDALRAQIVEPSEAGLMNAFALGGAALEAGASVLDLALAHHQALGQIGLEFQIKDPRIPLNRAAGFLTEALSPFDAALSGGRETNAQLIALNGALAEANLLVVAANDQLQAESRERQRAEEALWQAQKHQAVGRLAGGVAHHFNNLLTVILGNLDLVRRSHGDDPALVQKLSRASEAARKAVKLTRQLLTFSGRQMLRPDAFEPSKGLPDLIALLSGSLRGDVVVETQIPADLWAVRVDASELELALLNLAINAGDAMGGRGRLSFTAANCTVQDDRLGLRGEYLMIEVADDGPGIHPDVLPRVFDPFFTTKEIGVGTGLGLSQVLGFAHQSKGAVDIDSEPGQGARIRIFLPATRDTTPEIEAIPAQAGVILVVEDDVDVAEIATSMLDSHGFEVKLAYRGQVALDLLRRGEAVDLVFANVGLSGDMNGLALAGELKRDFPGLPVLLAAAAREAAEGAHRLGVPIIAKPYRSGELYSRINALLGARDGAGI
ncbi:MAG TPA: ATP-binding protein [Caulobacteraceae bacterium]